VARESNGACPEHPQQAGLPQLRLTPDTTLT